MSTPTRGAATEGCDKLEAALVDPVWKASWDFDFEATIAGRIRG